MAHALLSSPGLFPPELSWAVLDLAEYWPVESYETRRGEVVRVSVGVEGGKEQQIVLRTDPIVGGGRGGLEKCVRRIAVTTVSRDQGFSSFPEHHGTREGSSSWFELNLLRPVPPTPGGTNSQTTWRSVTRVPVHHNIHAGRSFEAYTTVFEVGDPIVDLAAKGDRLVLFALAEWPMWSNTCSACRVDVQCMI